MPLLLNAPSNNVDYGGMIYDEQYVLEWIDRTEPKEEPKYDDPTKLQKRFKCKFKIVGEPDGLTDAEGNDATMIGREITEFFTASMHEKSNFGPIVRAMLGRKADAKLTDLGADWDADSLCARFSDEGGGRFRATLIQRENGYPKIVTPLPVRGRPRPATDPNEVPF